MRTALAKPVREGMRLFKRFHTYAANRFYKAKCNRVMPPVVVQLGELKGVIYSSDRWSPGRKQNFIHFMENPPKLVSNPEGTQLYVVGGNYRVTQKGLVG